MREAEALAANLDDADRTIVGKIVQAVIDLRDAADLLTSTGDALTKERQALWNARAQDFGNQMEALRDRPRFTIRRSNNHLPNQRGRQLDCWV